MFQKNLLKIEKKVCAQFNHTKRISNGLRMSDNVTGVNGAVGAISTIWNGLNRATITLSAQGHSIPTNMLLPERSESEKFYRFLRFEWGGRDIFWNFWTRKEANSGRKWTFFDDINIAGAQKKKRVANIVHSNLYLALKRHLERQITR